ncbi:MAG: hypothetical protein RL708_1027 [Bacteroidota bacterium]|jgi:hypothetical protein
MTHSINEEIEGSKSIRDKYFYWREQQRKQLSESANLFFIFSSATIGFILKVMVDKVNSPVKCWFYIFGISLFFLVVSIISYTFLVVNRLYDFRKTANFYDEGKTTKEIEYLTKEKGNLTWTLFGIQMILLAIGLIFFVFGLMTYF